MFESAELGHTIEKEQFEAEVPALRDALLDAEFDLVQAKKFSVVILIGGVDGAGKGETVNLINEWMDPRHIETHATDAPTDEERERPPMWRFWRALPPKGKIGIFFGSWYTDPIVHKVYGRTSATALDESVEEINHFEKMLADDGVLLLKFWFHLSKTQQKARLKKLAKHKKTAWRVTEMDWRHFELYDRFSKVSGRVVAETSTAHAPWLVVEGADARYRSLTVGRAIADALRRRLDAEGKPAPEPPPPPSLPRVDGVGIIRKLDLSLALSEEEYEEELESLERKLNLLTRTPAFRERAVVAVFEGADAAGKGGAIRRITGSLDARQYRVVPIAAPSEEERAQPYLWRFWRHVPRKGKITIFDRSWYGRVLVERVEGFCKQADWSRAYGEINDFERQLADSGAIVAKFWLQISQEEQLRRFSEREKISFKRFKITAEDWRNREKWNAYEQAATDMIDRTSTDSAPWTLVEANDKLYARIKVLKTLHDRVEAALDG